MDFPLSPSGVSDVVYSGDPISLNDPLTDPIRRMSEVVPDSSTVIIPAIGRDRKNKIFLNKKLQANLSAPENLVREGEVTYLDSVFALPNNPDPILRKIRMSINDLVQGTIRYPYFKSIFRKYSRRPRCRSFSRPTFQNRSQSIRIFSVYRERFKTGYCICKKRKYRQFRKVGKA